MEISSHEEEIPIPINSVYGHMIHHHQHLNNNNNNNNNNIISSTNSGTQQVITIPSPPPPPTTNGLDHHEHHNIINNNNVVRASLGYEKSVAKYRECLKNHAAAMGGNATDGCGEFMPSGEEGSLEALTCSACNCHRNFHRKEVQGKLFLGHYPHHPKALMYSSSSRAVTNPPHQQMIMPYTATGPPHLHSESDEHDHHHHHQHQVVKKRFRTKFTQEQKEKMVSFAERVGWKIQKQEEGVVQQLCQEIGIKRRVLKVWMHNNKAKKSIFNPSSTSAA